jgi:hypothetical protein
MAWPLAKSSLAKGNFNPLERKEIKMFALIIPLSGIPGVPTHPIAPGGQPPGIWGGAPPYVDIGGPGQQPGISHPIAPGGQPPYPSQGPGFPTHPIAPGGQPPGYWGGVAPPYPSHPIAPGGQPPWASQGPGFPTQPIVLPPIQPGGPPVTIWPGPGAPSHPIAVPPPPEGTKPPPPEGGWGYSPEYGWGYFPAGGKPQPG